MAVYGGKVFVGTLENQEKGLENQTKILKILEENTPKRYGYRVKVGESDPVSRVEYLYDAVGMTPAKMNYESDTFDFGDWEDIWFVRDNFACVLNPDGSLAYKLKADDYTQREDGQEDERKGVDQTALANGENVMSAIPLVWVKRYQQDGYRYVIFCETQYDESYKAYAHTNKNGKVLPYVYHACYEPWMDCTDGKAQEGSYVTSQADIVTKCQYKSVEGKRFGKESCSLNCTGVADSSTAHVLEGGAKCCLRSVSGVQPTTFSTSEWERAMAQRNGAGWDMAYWSLNELIADLLTLMGKSTNSEEVFGTGYITRNTVVNVLNKEFMLTGTMDKKGQFWGSKEPTPNATQCPGDGKPEGKLCGCKVFHIENFWGSAWRRVVGCNAQNGDIKVKMTPEGSGYNLDGTGYPVVVEGKTGAVAGSGFIKNTIQTEYGSFPIPKYDGTDSTYECDYYWFQVDANARLALVGCCCYHGSYCGSRGLDLNEEPALVHWDFGGSLSYVEPS